MLGYALGATAMAAMISGYLWMRQRLRRQLAVSRRLRAADQSKSAELSQMELELAEHKGHAEERKRYIDELEAKNSELSRFTYTVCHDLKSPLVTIKGFLSLLERDAEAGEAERMEHDIRRIRMAADTMRRLLEDLLELSRAGRQIHPPQPLSMSELACEAVGLVAGQIAERGVEVEVASGLPVVHADRVRLLQVLQNLIANAVKFMGDQSTPRIEIGARQQGEETVFFVQDNGMGIAPEHHRKVFGLFDRLDQESEGTGVGLALVKQIVELHGGRVWVESEGRGQGSTFCLTLPDPAEEPASDQAQEHTL